MPHEQLRLQRVRVIEVDLMPLLGRVAVEVAVVRVVRDPLDPVFPDAVVDGPRHRSLSRSGSAGDADDDGSLHGPMLSSSSASVMKSEISSAPQMLQMAVVSLPLVYSN